MSLFHAIITFIHCVSYFMLLVIRLAAFIGKQIVSAIFVIFDVTRFITVYMYKNGGNFYIYLNDLKAYGYKVLEEIKAYGYRQYEAYMEQVESTGRQIEQLMQPVWYIGGAFCRAFNAIIRNVETFLILLTLACILWKSRRKWFNFLCRYCAKLYNAVSLWRRSVKREERHNDDMADLIEQQLCIACADHVKRVVVMPCRHLCLCNGCSKRMTAMRCNLRCPICRGFVSYFMEVYI